MYCCEFVVIFVCISGLKDLKELHLDRTLITDEGAAIIKGMTFIFSGKEMLPHCLCATAAHSGVSMIREHMSSRHF